VASVVVRPVVEPEEMVVPSVECDGVIGDEDVMVVEEMLEEVTEDDPVVEVADELEVELVKEDEDSVVELAELDSDEVGNALEDEDEDNVVDTLDSLELTLDDDDEE
jgi:hypothetical protein